MKSKKREHYKRRENLKKGYSLVESLLSLSLFLLIVLSSLQFFGFARRSFFKLKAAGEARESALSALEKMKFDVLHTGFGLLEPVRLGFLEGIKENEKTLILLSKDKDFRLLDELVPGQIKIPLDNTKGIKKKSEICIFDSKKGEVKRVFFLNRGNIVLSSPLNYRYSKEGSQLLLLKKISLFFDEKKQIIRRKVNNSPSQPLLEEVISFDFSYIKTANIVNLSLVLKSEKEKKYEISVFPKNISLAFIH